jgi:hypothetical protein
MPTSAPVIVEWSISVAVIDCVPAVLRMALKVCTPLSVLVNV